MVPRLESTHKKEESIGINPNNKKLISSPSSVTNEAFGSFYRPRNPSLVDFQLQRERNIGINPNNKNLINSSNSITNEAFRSFYRLRNPFQVDFQLQRISISRGFPTQEDFQFQRISNSRVSKSKEFSKIHLK